MSNLMVWALECLYLCGDEVGVWSLDFGVKARIFITLTCHVMHYYILIKGFIICGKHSLTAFLLIGHDPTVYDVLDIIGYNCP